MTGKLKAGKDLKKRRRKTSKLVPGDFFFTVLVLILVVFGVIMVFSASYYYSLNSMGSPYYYLIRELIFAVTGFALMMLFAMIDYHKLIKWGPKILLIGIILLILVITPLGTEINGAKRWLGAGIFTIMPGEIAKLCAIIFVAGYFGKDPKRILSFTRGILPMILLVACLAGLVMLQPNMSTAITIAGIVFVMMFIAGMQYRYVIGLFAVGGIAGIGMVAMPGGEYRRHRVTAFMDPFKSGSDEGYQVVQSLLALGSGGIFGKGLGKSVQKTLYLPEPQNDFILAVIGEELGYVGILILMIIYLLLIWRGVKIAMNAPDRSGLLLAGGITAMIGLQVILNVAVVTSSMPATGVILPFVSYGGNALWLFMIAAGIMLNISRHSRREGNISNESNNDRRRNRRPHISGDSYRR